MPQLRMLRTASNCSLYPPKPACHAAPSPRRPDAKNALYADTLKRGDLLLSRVQKLARVIDME